MIEAAPPVPVYGYRPVLREIARGGLSGFIAGFVVGGIGGRIAMRISALIDPSAKGAVTEGGATVGEFTLGGTVALVMFVGIFTGFALATVWVIAARWLPARGAGRYLVAAILAVAMGAHLAIEGRNIDFLILDPKWAQVTIFVALAALGGVVLVRVDRWLEWRLPAASGGNVLLYALIAAFGLLIASGVFALFVAPAEDCTCASRPRLPAALMIVLAAITAATWTFFGRGRRSPPWLATLGRLTLAAMITAGLLHLGGEIAHFT